MDEARHKKRRLGNSDEYDHDDISAMVKSEAMHEEPHLGAEKRDEYRMFETWCANYWSVYAERWMMAKQNGTLKRGEEFPLFDDMLYDYNVQHAFHLYQRGDEWEEWMTPSLA